MAPPFTREEYSARIARVYAAMERAGFEALIVAEPAHINWLTGYDAWSFYTPQVMILDRGERPVWIGREMDAGAAGFTTWMAADQVVPFDEIFVHQPDIHAGDFIGTWMAGRGLARSRIGYEGDAYFLSPRCLDAIRRALPAARLEDAGTLVNWCRLVKSPAELDMMRQAARLAGHAMRAAFDGLAPGVPQSALMADVVAAQIRGADGVGGDMTAVHPLVLAGERAATAHPFWDDSPFESGQTVAFELGGCRKRYNAGLARTAHIGKLPQVVADTAAAVEEGLVAVLETLRAGVSAETAHAAWQRCLDRHGLEKKSRIGYAIGVGYAPDWGEHTISLRPGARDVLPADCTVHVMLGMWLDGWGMELSETVHVHDGGCTCLTDFPRAVHCV